MFTNRIEAKARGRKFASALFSTFGMIALIGAANITLQCRKSDQGLKETNATPVALLTLTKGEVLVDDGRSSHPAAAGQTILPGQTLRTGPDSTAELFVKDQGIFRISENAEFTVKRVDATGTEFSQTKGSMAVFLKKVRQDSEFKISTPTAVASVRGTSFIVDVKSKKESNFALFDGSIEVTNQKGQAVVMDHKGEVTVTEKNDLSKEIIRPLSRESLAKLKKLAIFQKTQIEDYNKFVDQLIATDNEISAINGGPSSQEKTGEADSADKNLIKRDTRKDPLKIEPKKTFKQGAQP